MRVYIIATFISCLFAYLSRKITFCDRDYNNISKTHTKRNEVNLVRKKYNIFFVFLSMLPLFLISAVRYGVGKDFKLYETIFKYSVIDKKYAYYDTEWLYMWINKFIADITSNKLIIFIVTSLIIILFIYLAIYQQSESPCMSILLFVVSTAYFMSLNIVRQAMATAIFMYSIKYIRDNKIIKFMICSIISTGLHSISYIFFLLYFINKIKITPKKMCIYLGVIYISLPVINMIFYKVITYTKFIVYYQGGKWTNPSFQLLQLLINTALLVLYMYVYNSLKDDKMYKIYFNFQFLAVIACMLSAYVPLMYRIINIFTFVPIIYIPTLINIVKNKKERIFIRTAVIFCFCIFTMIDIVIKGNQGVLPYTTIFN